MVEEKGLNKPVKLKVDLAAFLGAISPITKSKISICGIISYVCIGFFL